MDDFQLWESEMVADDAMMFSINSALAEFDALDWLYKNPEFGKD